MSTTEPSAAGPSLSVEQLVAFNDELEALVRAGIPLERGLLAAGADYRGRLGRAIRDLGQRLAAGERLPEAMARSSAALPEVYRAIVEAGLRTGRLADALQGLSRIGQAMVEARRTIVLACFYPGLVLVMAYSLFLFFVVVLFPRFTAASASLRIDESWFVTVLERAGHSVALWGPIAPLALVGLIVAWSLAGRSRALDGGNGLNRLMARFPWVGRIIANYRAADFTDLLAHLIEHDVPLDQAVVLAGNATGDRSFRAGVARFGADLAAGSPSSSTPTRSADGLPPLVVWMIGSGHRQGALASGLRHLATAYRRKAERQADAFRVILPGLLLVVIGSGAVLAYGLLLFIPLRQLWSGLANPLN